MTAIALAPKSLNLIPEQWTSASWQEFLQIAENPEYAQAKFYYYQGSYYLEMGVGANHAFDNTVIIILISLFGMTKDIPNKGLTNCSYRKSGISESQPDISYYLSDRLTQAPQGNSIVDLNFISPPNLVIEIASSSIASDLGGKRLLYEEMEVDEYWVVDAQNLKITAFRILSNCGSERIAESQAIAGLKFALLEEALQLSREIDNSQLGSWFLSQIKLS